ncbi:transposase, IS4 family protein [mine drainage metagenome]|uniref:Transposase, IS4 family protein n=1 Tax=mine drainage metagenome TaxID=410659 RepID=T1B8F8_9ZZZZ
MRGFHSVGRDRYRNHEDPGMSSRWGNPYRDHRDGPSYTEVLVVRGKFFLDLGPFRRWEPELAILNRGKRGGQHRIPESFVRGLAIWMQHIDYRGREGITRRMARLGSTPPPPPITSPSGTTSTG